MTSTASSPPLTLEWLTGTYAVCRLDPATPLPAWVQIEAQSRSIPSLLSITRTDRELSIVIDQSLIPADAQVRVEREFMAMRVVGVLDFNLVGILAKLTSALAAADVPVFVISTFDTDVILLKSSARARSIEALSAVARIT